MLIPLSIAAQNVIYNGNLNERPLFVTLVGMKEVNNRGKTEDSISRDKARGKP